MAKALGVGGVFFKSPDPGRLKQWYGQWLGFDMSEAGPYVVFKPEQMPETGGTVWSPFEAGTTYFEPSQKDYMFNLVVDNLDEVLEQVQAGGAQMVGGIEAVEFGRFGWFVDPDGNKVELWEPAKPA